MAKAMGAVNVDKGAGDVGAALLMGADEDGSWRPFVHFWNFLGVVRWLDLD